MRHLIIAAMTAFLALASTSVVQAQTTEGTAEEMNNTNFVITVTQGNTQMGVIELKLWPDVAPKHVEFFSARVAEGYYDGTAFHRVIPGFMIQGGDPNSKDKPRETWGQGGYPEKVDAEFSDKEHNRGVLSAARTNDPNSFGGQFFICVGDANYLDGQYSAFGEVVSGMEVVDMVVNAPRDAADNPLEKIEMTVKVKETEYVNLMVRTPITVSVFVAMFLCFSQGNIVAQEDSTYLPQNLGETVNGPYDDILPVISPDGLTLYFCKSHSPDNIGGGRQDIWYSELQSTGQWGEARNIGIPLNNRDNNYLCSITPDGNLAIVGDGYSDARNKHRSIAISYRTINGWSVPKPLAIKDYYNDNRFGEFSLANDGKTLIMAIERKDSYGGKDLYVSFRQPDSSWSAPRGLGENVNSLGHEATPFIASDNSSLYFASDGQGGFGAFDVFVTRRLDSTWTKWSDPENLGPSINSEGWDLYYTIPAAGDYAYYVSYSNTFGAGDIFRIRLPESARPRPVVLVKGRVLNKKTGEPIEADIDYELLPSGKDLGKARSTPKTGKYKIVLPAGDRYGFRASAPGFISVNENLDLTGIKEYTEITRDLYLVPIEEGATVQLNNIFFDYDKWDLRPESFPELDRLSEVMEANPTMIVELAGHTDSRGGNAYNRRLSDRRANSVVEYLLNARQIPKERITPKGYGEEKPIATNETDEGRQLNRRVEFVILKK